MIHATMQRAVKTDQQSEKTVMFATNVNICREHEDKPVNLTGLTLSVEDRRGE